MDKPDRERIIIDAALKVFSRKGYADTRMADIAREAEMSYGLVYHYFENKEKLFDAIVEEWWTGFYNKLEALKKSPMPTDEKLIGIIRYLLSVYATSRIRSPSSLPRFPGDLSIMPTAKAGTNSTGFSPSAGRSSWRDRRTAFSAATSRPVISCTSFSAPSTLFCPS